MKKTTGILLAGLMALGLSCGLENQTTLVEDSLGQVSIQAPIFWTTFGDYNQYATMNLSEPLGNAYLIVIVENKEDFYDGELEEYADLVVGGLESSLILPSISSPKVLDIDGLKGIQYTITGNTQGLDIKYIHTSVESEKYYSQIMGWALEEDFEQYTETFDKMIASFQEVSEEANDAEAEDTE